MYSYATSLGSALNGGLVTEADIDVALSRVLRQRFRVGSFDPAAGNPYRSIPVSELESVAHLSLSLAAGMCFVTTNPRGV